MVQVPRVVVDTNVVVAGLRSKRGASFRLLSDVGKGRFEIALSVPLVLEYEDALLRHSDVTRLRAEQESGPAGLGWGLGVAKGRLLPAGSS